MNDRCAGHTDDDVDSNNEDISDQRTDEGISFHIFHLHLFTDAM